MRSLSMSRGTKALTLVPLALVSGAWTIVVAGSGAVEGASSTSRAAASDSPLLPEAALEGPAGAMVPGRIATAVSAEDVDWVVSAASPNGIPSPAIASYQRAAQVINGTDTTCRLPWELLAAVGRVESDHGRYDRNVLGDDGVSRPGVVGIALDGKNGTAHIADTDGGDLDYDPFFDHAVGPMQLLPSTWSAVRVDADGDGRRDPQDIDDAALAAAIFLCSGAEDLSARAGQESAVLRYNGSHDYVNMVLRVMEAYAAGDYTAVPAGVYGGQVFVPDAATQLPGKRPRAPKPAVAAGPATSAPEPEAAAPPAPTGEKAGGATRPSAGLAGTVADVVARPAEAVPVVLTELAATTRCLQDGIAALDVRALAACVRDLLR